MSNEPRDTNREARERKAAKAKASAEGARKRALLIRVGAAIAVIVVVVGVVVVLALRKDTVDTSAALPAGVANAGGGVVTGSGPAVIDVYEDFQCPACAQFEAANAPTLEKLAAQGKAMVIYHPMHFLDDNIGSGAPNPDSSLRAANAAGCAADQGKYTAYHQKLYAAQPAKEGDGYTDAALLQVGSDVGLKAAPFQQCVKELTFEGWANQVERESRDRGITGTPTVLLNGAKLDLNKVLSTTDGGQKFDEAKWFAVVEAAGAASPSTRPSGS